MRVCLPLSLPTYLAPLGELKGEPLALPKGLVLPGWLRGDVAQQYLKANSLGWLAGPACGPLPPPAAAPPAVLCDAGPQVLLSTLSALTCRMTSSSAAATQQESV